MDKRIAGGNCRGTDDRAVFRVNGRVDCRSAGRIAGRVAAGHDIPDEVQNKRRFFRYFASDGDFGANRGRDFFYSLKNTGKSGDGEKIEEEISSIFGLFSINGGIEEKISRILAAVRAGGSA